MNSKQVAIKALEKAGLVNVTTKKREKFGSLAFKDPKLFIKDSRFNKETINTVYTLHPNGCVRKPSTYGIPYQINPKIKVPFKRENGINDFYYDRIYYPEDFVTMANIVIKNSAKSRAKL